MDVDKLILNGVVKISMHVNPIDKYYFTPYIQTKMLIKLWPLFIKLKKKTKFLINLVFVKTNSAIYLRISLIGCIFSNAEWN